RTFQDVKSKLLSQLTNAGNPIIRVLDANHENRGELLLQHDHQGVDLRLDWAQEVLGAIQRVWKRPVELHTSVEGKGTRLRVAGDDYTQKPL
ncbi:MAG: SpoVR family protein, partial [Myxococcota bacterium]